MLQLFQKCSKNPTIAKSYKKKKLRITALHPSLTYSVHIPAPLPPVIPLTVYIYHKARGKRQHFTFRACLRGGGGPQVSEVTRLTAVEK